MCGIVVLAYAVACKRLSKNIAAAEALLLLVEARHMV